MNIGIGTPESNHWMAIHSILFAASAFIILSLGAIHLFYTFYGARLHPRNRDLRKRMQEDSPVLTKETTMWKAWIGFNASHSLGAIFFGVVYLDLSLEQNEFLIGSCLFKTLGLAVLIAYFFLGRAYWFSVPFRCISLALVLFVAAIICTWF